MNDFGLYSNRAQSTPAERHFEWLDERMRAILSDLRNYVKSLGNNVIEEVRPHRIVYAKSLTFRTFLDVQPANDHLLISIRKSRAEPIITHKGKNIHDLRNIKGQIEEAYNSIS